MRKVAFTSFLLGALVSGSIVWFFLQREIQSSRASSALAAIPVPCATPSAPPQIKQCTLADLQNQNFIPALPPPVFSSKTPEKLRTNFEGEVHLRWRSVVGAKNYIIVVEDLTGQPVRKYTATATSMYLKNLPLPVSKEFEKYRVRLATTNAIDVAGPFGEARELLAKKPVDLMAPSIKEVRVED